jgi:hypothetical protein
MTLSMTNEVDLCTWHGEEILRDFPPPAVASRPTAIALVCSKSPAFLLRFRAEVLPNRVGHSHAKLCKIATRVAASIFIKSTTYISMCELRTRGSEVRILPGAPSIDDSSNLLKRARQRSTPIDHDFPAAPRGDHTISTCPHFASPARVTSQ